MLNATMTMRATMTGPRPFKRPFTIGWSPYLNTRKKTMTGITPEGITRPSVETMAPHVPAALKPTSDDPETATGPGVKFATYMICLNWSAETQWLTFTASCSIRARFAKPDPNPRRPILKNVQNSFRYITTKCYTALDCMARVRMIVYIELINHLTILNFMLSKINGGV